MKIVNELKNLSGKRVLVRVDWNVPTYGGAIRDDFRIRKSLSTLEYLKDAGAKVILATHFEPVEVSLEPLKEYLPEDVDLLPNLRLDPGEESSDEKFAEKLAKNADLFVNEAFSVSHRRHASIVGVPKFLPSYAGLQFKEEVDHLSQVFNPPHPFLVLLGGLKIETKLPLVENLSRVADEIFIGGAMAKSALELDLDKKFNVFFPSGDLAALDANGETLEILKSKIQNSKLIVWNGPLGKYEDGYTKCTQELAKVLASAAAEVIVGGGDTLMAIRDLDLYDKFSFVSTGGGAMLDFLANGTLPGIEALRG